MKNTHSYWRFNKAGQGCFYSGIIQSLKYSSKNPVFTFVYDCGSKLGSAYLRDEIIDFKVSLNTLDYRSLDLLVISHLDADHTNQVKNLLSGLDNCKLAILPYLSNLERLFLFFQNGFNESTDNEDYASLILDPAGYLFSRGVEKVIFVDGGDSNNLTAENDVPTPPPTSDSNDNYQLSFKVRTHLKVIPKYDLSQEQETYLTYIGNNRDKVSFVRDRNKIYAGVFWEFYFYNKKQEISEINKFKSFIENRFAITITGEGLSFEQLKNIFEKSKNVTVIKERFETVFEDCNSTGLVVLHGPINSTGVSLYRKYFDSDHYQNSFYTLLNGDIFLNNINYPTYILNVLKDIRVFQVPHHGADLNWDASGIGQLTDVQMVINYGKGNKYKHPGNKTIAEINSNWPFWTKRRNTQFKSFNYRLFSQYK